MIGLESALGGLFGCLFIRPNKDSPRKHAMMTPCDPYHIISRHKGSSSVKLAGICDLLALNQRFHFKRHPLLVYIVCNPYLTEGVSPQWYIKDDDLHTCTLVISSLLICHCLVYSLCKSCEEDCQISKINPAWFRRWCKLTNYSLGNNLSSFAHTGDMFQITTHKVNKGSSDLKWRGLSFCYLLRT